MRDNYDILVEYIISSQEKFYRLAFSYVREKEAALDVVQDGICRMLEKSEHLRNIEAMRSWCYTILVNEALQYMKKRKREVLTDQLEEQASEEISVRTSNVFEEIDKLPRIQREVVILRFCEELSLKEIAQITGTNENTVKTRLYGALRKLGVTVKEELA